MSTEKRLIRIAEVCRKTGLSRPTIYRLIKRQQFPAQVPLLGGTIVGWDANAVDEWITKQIQAASAAA